MTLKERLQEENVYINAYNFKLTKECAEKFEEIAEEFAIGFAEWLYRYDNTRLPNGNWIIKLGLKPYTSEEVLEIYKQGL